MVPFFSNLFIRAVFLTAFSAMALPAVALEVGDKAPDFKAKSSLGGNEKEFRLQKALSKGTVVIYFYPSAFTSGCNLQAYTFSKHMDDFKAAGASVIGVSLDSMDRLNEFSVDQESCAGNVQVASDPDGKIAKAYGVAVSPAKEGARDIRQKDIGHAYAKRVTFVVKPSGIIAAVIADVSPQENVAKALEEAKKLAKK